MNLSFNIYWKACISSWTVDHTHTHSATREVPSFATTNGAKLCGLLPVNVQNWPNLYFYVAAEILIVWSRFLFSLGPELLTFSQGFSASFDISHGMSLLHCNFFLIIFPSSIIAREFSKIHENNNENVRTHCIFDIAFDWAFLAEVPNQLPSSNEAVKVDKAYNSYQCSFEQFSLLTDRNRRPSRRPQNIPSPKCKVLLKNI